MLSYIYFNNLFSHNKHKLYSMLTGVVSEDFCSVYTSAIKFISIACIGLNEYMQATLDICSRFNFIFDRRLLM